MKAKLQYMDNHQISHSVISLANPWLDFLSGKEAENVAIELNDELQGKYVDIYLYILLCKPS